MTARIPNTRRRGCGWTALYLLVCPILTACGSSHPTSGDDNPSPDPVVFEGPVGLADCGPGSLPETDIQGRVPAEDRRSGRSEQGYRCNMEIVGRYQGQGSTWISPSFRHCAYLPQSFPASVLSLAPGVHVVDVRDPVDPKLAARLTSQAFIGSTWESLKINERRGLLAGVFGGPLIGAAAFDVYDVGTDCLAPKLLNSVGESALSLPILTLGHEGEWSPDGNTFWATGLVAGVMTAIDVADPSRPRVAYSGSTGLLNHGLAISEDGTRLYLAQIGAAGLINNGLVIFDVSEVQARKSPAQIHRLGSVFWTDGGIGQHAIPVSWDGRPHVIFVDENLAGGARIIDVSDESNPSVISKLKLEVHMPGRFADSLAETVSNGVFGYEAHYCEVDRREDPTAIACGYFQSGVRVFDIRNPRRPREIAYFNPPAQVGRRADLAGSEHASGALGLAADMTTDWCSSPPRFVAPDQLWVTCQDNGFMVLRFTNGAYPLP